MGIDIDIIALYNEGLIDIHKIMSSVSCLAIKMEVDITGLVDEGIIELDNIMSSDCCVKTEIGVIAKGETYSFDPQKNQDVKIPAEVVLEKGIAYGITAYTWFSRDADDPKYYGESQWYIEKDEAIKQARKWISYTEDGSVDTAFQSVELEEQKQEEKQEDHKEILDKIRQTKWFRPNVENQHIAEIVDAMVEFRDKGVLKVWTDSTHKRVESPTDYDKAGYQVFVVCDYNNWMTHASNLLRAVETHENDE